MARHRSLLVVVMLVLLAAACSSGDDSSTSPSSSTVTTAAATATTTAAPTSTEPVVTVNRGPGVTEDQSIGPPKPGDIPTPRPPACSLAGTDDVAAITGTSGVEPVNSQGLGYLTCEYTAAGGAVVATVSLITEYGHPPAIDAFAALVAAPDAEPVPALGDEAVWTADSLHVRVGQVFVTMTLAPQGALATLDARRAATLALAAVVVPRFIAHEAG